MLDVKCSLALLAVVLLGLGAGACGDTGKGGGAKTGGNAAAAARMALPKVEFSIDDDSDSDRYPHEFDNESEALGHPASLSDTRQVTTLVKRYYAAATREDGAAACRSIYSSLAEAIPEDYGGSSGRPSLRGRTCAVVLSKLFKQLHSRLRGAVRVASVRVDLNLARVLLGFDGAKPNRYILAHRERGVWKMGMLTDVGYPVGVE